MYNTNERINSHDYGVWHCFKIEQELNRIKKNEIKTRNSNAKMC